MWASQGIKTSQIIPCTNETTATFRRNNPPPFFSLFDIWPFWKRETQKNYAGVDPIIRYLSPIIRSSRSLLGQRLCIRITVSEHTACHGIILGSYMVNRMPLTNQRIDAHVPTILLTRLGLQRSWRLGNVVFSSLDAPRDSCDLIYSLISLVI